jgi:hypothetical protein
MAELSADDREGLPRIARSVAMPWRNPWGCTRLVVPARAASRWSADRTCDAFILSPRVTVPPRYVPPPLNRPGFHGGSRRDRRVIAAPNCTTTE